MFSRRALRHAVVDSALLTRSSTSTSRRAGQSLVTTQARQGASAFPGVVSRASTSHLSRASHTVAAQSGSYTWTGCSPALPSSVRMMALSNAGRSAGLSPLVPRRPAVQKRMVHSWSVAMQQEASTSASSNGSTVVRLQRLESLANANPLSTRAQLAYLRALNLEMPEQVIQRVEFAKYTDKRILMEYLKALARTGKLRLSEGGSAKGALATDMGTSANPVSVIISEATGKQAWRTVRVIGVTVLVLGFINALMEDHGVNRGGPFNSNHDVPMVTETGVTLDDVKGVEEAKEELQEVVSFLRNPERYTSMGGKLPKGVLLVGPPGTGKTLLARAVAGEAKVPFFYVSGSEFEEVFVGVGAKRVRELFEQARKNAPCIIFIDEMDALGGKRNAKDQQYVKMTLNQLLVEMDGFRQAEGVVVLGATNLPEAMDPALLRPGRFDREVVVGLPDVRGREDILGVHIAKVKFDTEAVDLKVIARGTPGFTGADLANLINVAVLHAVAEDKPLVNMADLEWAIDRIAMGSERKSAIIEPEDRKLTAYHEGGHTLVALFTEKAMPLHKVTILPRGKALGVTKQLPKGDVNSVSRAELLARLDVCMGGTAAEELIYGTENVTTGASSDLQQATNIARAMVMRYGMSEVVGKQSISSDDYMIMSDAEKKLIDREVTALLTASYERAKQLLADHEEQLHALANALLELENMDVKQVRAAIGMPEGDEKKTTTTTTKAGE